MRAHELPAAIGFPVSRTDLSDDSKSGQLATDPVSVAVSPAKSSCTRLSLVVVALSRARLQRALQTGSIHILLRRLGVDQTVPDLLGRRCNVQLVRVPDCAVVHDGLLRKVLKLSTPSSAVMTVENSSQ
jgi:hypothetical protein